MGRSLKGERKGGKGKGGKRTYFANWADAEMNEDWQDEWCDEGDWESTEEAGGEFTPDDIAEGEEAKNLRLHEAYFANALEPRWVARHMERTAEPHQEQSAPVDKYNEFDFPEKFAHAVS